MSNRNRLLAIIAAILVVVLVVVAAITLNRPGEEPSDVAASPVASEEASPTDEAAEPAEESSAPLSPSPSSSADSAYECTTATEAFVPVRYTFEGSMDVDETVIAVGEDESGSIGAPPKVEKRTAAWWENGPYPGPTEGKVVLSIHTYRNGGALGNEMYEGGESQLKEGDVIKLYGANDEIACYEFTGADRVMVEEYDADSDAMVDFEGDPELVMIICWDFNPDADEEAGEDPWESRIFFNGTMF